MANPDLPQLPRSKVLSALARKYGAPERGEHTLLRGTKKSGWTPTSPLRPNNPKSPRSWYARKRLERYQKRRFRGWTARELQSMEALGAFQYTRLSDLSNDIHPLFRIERWESKETVPLHLPTYPLGKGRDGYWEASENSQQGLA
jgi:hypothetical protein